MGSSWLETATTPPNYAMNLQQAGRANKRLVSGLRRLSTESTTIWILMILGFLPLVR
jgi:hypothetical protein